MIWKAAAADDKSRIVEFFIKKEEAKQGKELRVITNLQHCFMSTNKLGNGR
jgi:hypothetical protein